MMTLFCIIFTVAKSKEVTTGSRLTESSKEACNSKRVVLPMMMRDIKIWRNTYKNIWRKLERIKQFRICRPIYENNIEGDLNYMNWEDVDWIKLVQHRVQPLLNTAVNPPEWPNPYLKDNLPQGGGWTLLELTSDWMTLRRVACIFETCHNTETRFNAVLCQI